MDNNAALFETAPVPRALASLAIPTIISQPIVMVCSLADTFETAELTAVFRLIGTGAQKG